MPKDLRNSAAPSIPALADVHPDYGRRFAQMLDLTQRRERLREELRGLLESTSSGHSSFVPDDELSEARAKAARRKASRVAALVGEAVEAIVAPPAQTQANAGASRVGEIELELEDIRAAEVWLADELEREHLAAASKVCTVVAPHYAQRLAALDEAARGFAATYQSFLGVVTEMERADVPWRRFLPAPDVYAADALGRPDHPGTALARFVAAIVATRELAGPLEAA